MFFVKFCDILECVLSFIFVRYGNFVYLSCICVMMMVFVEMFFCFVFVEDY